MKLLYLTHQYFPRHIGGTEVYLRGIVRRAVAAGHECRIISCHEDPSQNPDDFHVEQTEFEGVPILEIHFNLSVTKNPARFEYFNPFVQETVLSELEIFHPHLVHAMHAMKLSGSALRACRVSCVPIIVTLCDYWFICPRHTLLKWDDSLCDGPSTSFKCLPCLRQLHRFAVLPKNPSKLGLFLREVRAISGRSQFLRQELLRANRIIALSHFQKEMFVKNGYPHDRIEVVPHGIEVSDLVIGEHVPNFSGKLRIGFIGNLVPFKGAHILIEAITRDPSLQVECLIYGPLTESLYCRKLRDKAANDQRIKFMGKFPTDQLGCVLRSTDILALPALWYENNPLVVQGALHLGVPVLASQIGSLSDMIHPGNNGWLVKPGDVDEWTNTIREINFENLPKFAPMNGKTMDANSKEVFEIYEQEARR